MAALVRSALYSGTLLHARTAPVRYAFRHRVGFCLFDLAELPRLSRRLGLFGYNRAALVSLHDRDYGDGAQPIEASLRTWLAGQGAPLPRGRILLLTQARILGYVFNPVSFFYCYDEDGRLRCVVAEVNNTFGDRHRYLLDGRTADGPGQHRTDKLMHVSPFFSLDCSYRFRFTPEAPEESDGAPLRVHIEVREAGDRAFSAALDGRRGALSDRAIALWLLRHPLNTLRILFLIHYHALRLFLRGARFHPQPPYDPEAARRMHARTNEGPGPAARAGGAADGAPPGAAPPGGPLD